MAMRVWRILQLRNLVLPMAEDNPVMPRSTFRQTENEGKTIHKGVAQLLI